LREQSQNDEPRQQVCNSKRDDHVPTRRPPARWRHITYI
jgi:hypothetical protein